MNWNKTKESEPPQDQQLLVLRKPDFFHKKPWYEIVTYRRIGHGVDAMRSGSNPVGLFNNGKSHVNPCDCPLWAEIGPMPEIEELIN